MKFLILMMISFNCFAGSWLPKLQVCEGLDGLVTHSKKNDCEDMYSPDRCINVRGENLSHCRVRPASQLKRLAEACVDEGDCQTKLEAIECKDETWQAIKTEDEVYCTKFRPEKIVVDDDKKAIKDAAKAARIQEKLDRKAEIQEIKGFISDVNASDKPGWEKKILRKLIRDLKDE